MQTRVQLNYAKMLLIWVFESNYVVCQKLSPHRIWRHLLSATWFLNNLFANDNKCVITKLRIRCGEKKISIFFSFLVCDCIYLTKQKRYDMFFYIHYESNWFMCVFQMEAWIWMRFIFVWYISSEHPLQMSIRMLRMTKQVSRISLQNCYDFNGVGSMSLSFSMR